MVLKKHGQSDEIAFYDSEYQVEVNYEETGDFIDLLPQSKVQGRDILLLEIVNSVAGILQKKYNEDDVYEFFNTYNNDPNLDAILETDGVNAEIAEVLIDKKLFTNNTSYQLCFYSDKMFFVKRNIFVELVMSYIMQTYFQKIVQRKSPSDP